jgi:predicted ATPase
MLAEGYEKLGDNTRAMMYVDDALERANRTGERFYEPELHRVKGALYLKGMLSEADRAEGCFCNAITIARKQEAKWWELRASTSLARLLDKQGRRDEAPAMLANIYNWFTEGFDTVDLKQAKALLDELQA